MSTMSDPIADLLTRIRNACLAKHKYCDVLHSKMIQAILDQLKAQGFIEEYKEIPKRPRNVLRVYLRYNKERNSVIHGLTRVSKPGARRYVASSAIPRIFGGMGISILSTSQGVLSGHEAVKRGIGGEQLCNVW